MFHPAAWTFDPTKILLRRELVSVRADAEHQHEANLQMAMKAASRRGQVEYVQVKVAIERELIEIIKPWLGKREANNGFGAALRDLLLWLGATAAGRRLSITAAAHTNGRPALHVAGKAGMRWSLASALAKA
jgi:hypothetical protein